MRAGTEEDPGWGVPALTCVTNEEVLGKKMPVGKKHSLKTVALAVKMKSLEKLK